MTLLEDLRSFCSTMRVALEPGLLKGAGGLPDSAGSCLYASVLLATSMNRFSVAQAAIVGGGDGVAGALDARGLWHGHYWVKAVLKDGSVAIADITADQFGHDAVRVMTMTEAAAWYRAGEQELVDDAVRVLAQDLGCLDYIRFEAVTA